MRTIITSALPIATLIFAATSTQAAMLTGSVNTTIDGNQDLTTLGVTDWAIWDHPNVSDDPVPAFPSNRKLGGSGISDLSPVGGGNLRGLNAVTSPATFDFSYTDGTAPVSQSNFVPRGIGNTQLDNVGSGFSLTVEGTTFGTNTVQLYVSGFNGTGSLTASLNGATSYLNSSGVYGGSKSAVLYTIEFQPDSDTDLLTLQYVLGSDTGTSAHVLLEAVALTQAPEPTPIPEPSSLSLAALSLAAFAGFRRKRNRSRA